MTQTLSALALAPDETHVWYVHDREITHPERLRACAAVLSQDERIRQTRFYFAHDRHQFLVTRALVRDVLSRYYPHVAPGAWTFGKTAWGKPFVKNLPDGERLYFNVSHTPGLVALAATRAGEVGIDVEQPRQELFSLALAKTLCSEREYAALLALPDREMVARFFALWRLKEAYAKARGCGLTLNFHDVSFQLGTNMPIEVTFYRDEEVTPDAWFFAEVDLESGSQAALAVRSQEQGGAIVVQKVPPLVGG